jgi:hypothetical protein
MVYHNTFRNEEWAYPGIYLVHGFCNGSTEADVAGILTGVSLTADSKTDHCSAT